MPYVNGTPAEHLNTYPGRRRGAAPPGDLAEATARMRLTEESQELAHNDRRNPVRRPQPLRDSSWFDDSQDDPVSPRTTFGHTHQAYTNGVGAPGSHANGHQINGTSSGRPAYAVQQADPYSRPPEGFEPSAFFPSGRSQGTQPQRPVLNPMVGEDGQPLASRFSFSSAEPSSDEEVRDGDPQYRQSMVGYERWQRAQSPEDLRHPSGTAGNRGRGGGRGGAPSTRGRG